VSSTMRAQADMITETICIYINCRLIKDHHKFVVLQADIMHVDLKLGAAHTIFQLPPPPLNEDEPWPPREPQIHHIAIQPRDRQWQGALPSITLRHIMGFFAVRVVLDPSQTGYLLEVELLLDVVAQQRVPLSRDLYVEEHFRVYNEDHIFEKYVLSARLVCYDAANTIATSSIRTDTFDVGTGLVANQALEIAVIQFLQEYHVLWAEIFSRVASHCSTQESPKESKEEREQAPAWGARAARGSQPVQSREQLEVIAALLEEQWESAAHRKVFIDYCFLTDELIYYALKGQASGSDTHAFVGHQSSLLYSAALGSHEFSCIGASFQQFGQRVPRVISYWVEQLATLLSFFPASRAGVRHLRMLLKECDWTTTAEEDCDSPVSPDNERDHRLT